MISHTATKMSRQNRIMAGHFLLVAAATYQANGLAHVIATIQGEVGASRKTAFIRSQPGDH